MAAELGEIVVEYVSKLWRYTVNCKFEPYLKESFQDRFFCGLKREGEQKKPLTEADLVFKNAVKIA